MSLITRRPRSLRDGVAQLMAFSATYAAGVCIRDLVTHRHSGLLGIAIPAAGALSGIGAVRIFQAATRKVRDTPTDHHGEPDCPAVPGLAPEVVILVDEGRKIQAIKRYRELNPGIGLKEAKNFIDELAARSRTLVPPAQRDLSPGRSRAVGAGVTYVAGTGRADGRQAAQVRWH